MMNEDVLHRSVTKFLQDTCQLGREHSACLFRCIPKVIDLLAVKGSQPFPSGSSAELYIKPMLSCIGDFDIMASRCDLLCTPQGHSPPTELPGHYASIVYVFEIIPSHQPGYVYLRKSYEQVVEDKSRVTQKVKKTTFFLNHSFPSELETALDLFKRGCQDIQNSRFALSLDVFAHGPAISGVCEIKQQGLHFSHLSIDYVRSIRCLTWPPQASDWPLRSRNHGWPIQQSINVVVSNGCDVVGAVHPSCRENEWANKHQWRLSFSRSEITLLNCWTPVQQIVFHMLRFVVKREVLSKINDENPAFSTLSNYHIKTLMLWACEQKPQSWWSPESSLVKLCSSLLHKLSEWVANEHCQHYFISNCNIVSHFGKQACMEISKSLKSLADESFLLPWFIENYIRVCAKKCPAEVSVLFEDIRSSDKLEQAVDAVVDWKRNTLTQELCSHYHEYEKLSMSLSTLYHTDASCTRKIMKELVNLDLRLREYFIAVTSLRVAYKISIHSLTEDLLEILWSLFDSCTVARDMDTIRSQTGGFLFTSKAIKLATLSTSRSHALEMLHKEMSKAYLHYSFAHRQESTGSVTHVLLAALYYTSGHYQATINHCKQVLNRCDDDLYGLKCIEAEYLPQIDENVGSVFGLFLMYQHVQQLVLNPDEGLEQRTQKPTVTLQLIAYYLLSKSLTAANFVSHEMRNYRHRLRSAKSIFLCDVLLFKEIGIQIDNDDAGMLDVCNPTEADADGTENTSSIMDTELLKTLLELVAVEKLINVRQLMVRELHSDRFPVLNEFEALYAYKCGLFESCLELCRHNVNLLLAAGCPRHQYYVIVQPDLLSLLDGELLSLFGIIRLKHRVFLLFMLEFSDTESISMLTLFLYLMFQCQKKLDSDSLRDTLKMIFVAHEKMSVNATFLDRMILQLTYRSLKLYIGYSAFANADHY